MLTHYDHVIAAAAAAKSLQLCPTLCDPIDGSPPGSPVSGILQARTLEWVTTSFLHVSVFCVYIAYTMEKAMAPHSSTLAWKIPWTEEPGRLQSMGSRRVRHD